MTLPDTRLFEHPIFEHPSDRDLSRVGVVDIGSNSVRMVVFDGAARSPAYFFNEKIMCALGKGLAETGHLNPEGRVRAFNAIKRFQILAKDMDALPLTAVATAAVREASDGADFCTEVSAHTGLNIHVIDGAEEARLSAQGVLLGWPGAYGMICDIGGASMELARIGDGHVNERLTSPLGPLKLRNIKGGKKGLKAHIKSVLEEMRNEIGFAGERLFLVGGSWRAIARLDMARRNYPLTVLHEYRMTPKSVMETVNWISENDIGELRALTGTSPERMVLVPHAALVLRELVRMFKPKDIAISSYGIREGMLYEQMPDQLKRRDPLIEACLFAEQKDARFPGHGKALFDFLTPLFSAAKPDRMRLIQAACLLHDVTWRAHPDYRADVCFDNATRANLGGLRHRERVYLGLALLHRYKNSRGNSPFEDMINLLTPDEIKHAEMIGKAMRFGAMFSVENPARVARLKYYPKKKILELRLTDDGRTLFGEVAQTRFQHLANALGADTVVKKLRV